MQRDDRTIDFGGERFIFHDLYLSDLDYDYAFYVDSLGAILINRISKSGNTVRYAFAVDGNNHSVDYDSAFAARASYNYLVISRLNYPKITTRS